MTTHPVQTEFITLTPTAAQAIKDLISERNFTGYALRVFVSGKSCSGLQYGMALDNEIRPQDLTGACEGVNLVVDEISIQYMQGSVIDYVDDETGKGFKIDNPNVISTACGAEGCGQGSTSCCGSDGCQ